MQAIWEAMWEATWPKGPTTLTSTLLARLGLFEVLDNALNITLFFFFFYPHSLSRLHSSPLALCFPPWEHNRKVKAPAKTNTAQNQINFQKLWCNCDSFNMLLTSCMTSSALMSEWRIRGVASILQVIRHTRDVTLLGNDKVLPHASFI